MSTEEKSPSTMTDEEFVMSRLGTDGDAHKEETQDGGENIAPNTEDGGDPDTQEEDHESDTPQSDQEEAGGGDADTLTIPNDQKVWTTNEKGERIAVPFSKLIGGTKLKSDYDAWIENEKKPLEEAKQQLETYLDALEEDPVGLWTEQFKTIVQDFEMKPADLLGGLIGFLKGMGYPNVGLMDTSTGEQYDLPAPQKSDGPTPRERKLEKRLQELEGKQTAELDKVQLETVLSNYEDVPKEVRQSAKELMEQYREVFTKGNPDNPWEPAVKMALANSGQTVSKKKEEPKKEPTSRRRGLSTPKKPFDDTNPDVKFMKDKGILRVN